MTNPEDKPLTFAEALAIDAEIERREAEQRQATRAAAQAALAAGRQEAELNRQRALENMIEAALAELRSKQGDL